MKQGITVKNVYGVERIFPVNDTAKLFCELIGRKTFDESHLTVIRSLGYEITQVNNNKLWKKKH